MEKMTDKQEKHIAKLIDWHLAYVNGWRISDEQFTEDCKKLSKKIRKYLSKQA